MREKWAQLERYPNYDVSDRGQVRNRRTRNIIKSHPDKRGYMRVTLFTDEGKRVTVPVFRLVAISFCMDTYFQGAVATPKDGDRSNLKAINVKWVTFYEANKWNSGRRDWVRRAFLDPDKPIPDEIIWETP